MHIRRSDYGNRIGNDDDIMGKINKCKDNIYIATDSNMVKQKLSKLTNKVFYNTEQMNINNYRSTSLKIAIIDLFMCIYSDNFFMENNNNHISTFTGFINIYRKYLHK